jgi:t-SNARE complex subunit (syntaxin)
MTEENNNQMEMDPEEELEQLEEEVRSLHENLDQIKDKGRELHQNLMQEAKETGNKDMQFQYQRIAMSARNLYLRLQEGDSSVVRGDL